jgi:hypothetical protein
VVEQGLVLLIQSGISSLTPSVPGGFAAELPKDQISASSPMAWTYRSITSEASYHLGGQDAFTGWNVQIDCHGYTMANAIALARAIDGVLRGIYQGTLPDTDQTFVQGIFRDPQFVDGYSDANRSFVRTMEYLVQYDQQ